MLGIGFPVPTKRWLRVAEVVEFYQGRELIKLVAVLAKPLAGYEVIEVTGGETLDFPKGVK